MYGNTRTTALRIRRRRRLRPPSDPRGLLSRLASLVAFVRLSLGAMEKRLLDRKAPRLETTPRWLAGGIILPASSDASMFPPKSLGRYRALRQQSPVAASRQRPSPQAFKPAPIK